MKTLDEAYRDMWAKFDAGRRERGAMLRSALESGVTWDELQHRLLKVCAAHKKTHVRLVHMGPGPFCIPLSQLPASE